MPKVKKWYSNRYSYKSILHRVIRWKLLLDGGRNDTFDSWRRRFSGGGFFLQKYFDKICLKAARANMWSVIKGQRDSVFWWGDIQQRGKVQTFRLAGRPTPKYPSLVGHSDLPIRENLRRLLDLLTAMILERVSESIFFRISKFTACKINDKKEVENSLIAFNLWRLYVHFNVRCI